MPGLIYQILLCLVSWNEMDAKLQSGKDTPIEVHEVSDDETIMVVFP